MFEEEDQVKTQTQALLGSVRPAYSLGLCSLFIQVWLNFINIAVFYSREELADYRRPFMEYDEEKTDEKDPTE